MSGHVFRYRALVPEQACALLILWLLQLSYFLAPAYGLWCKAVFTLREVCCNIWTRSSAGINHPSLWSPLSHFCGQIYMANHGSPACVCECKYLYINTHVHVCNIYTSLEGFQEPCLNWQRNHTSKMEDNALNGNDSKNRTRSGDADFRAFLFPKGRRRVPWSCSIPSPRVRSLATWALNCVHVQGWTAGDVETEPSTWECSRSTVLCSHCLRLLLF